MDKEPSLLLHQFLDLVEFFSGFRPFALCTQFPIALQVIADTLKCLDGLS